MAKLCSHLLFSLWQSGSVFPRCALLFIFFPLLLFVSIFFSLSSYDFCLLFIFPVWDIWLADNFFFTYDLNRFAKYFCGIRPNSNIYCLNGEESIFYRGVFFGHRLCETCECYKDKTFSHELMIFFKYIGILYHKPVTHNRYPNNCTENIFSSPSRQ